MITLNPVCSSVSMLTEIYICMYIYVYIHSHAQSFIAHVFSMQLRRITCISNARNACHIITPILCVNFKEMLNNWTGNILRDRDAFISGLLNIIWCNGRYHITAIWWYIWNGIVVLVLSRGTKWWLLPVLAARLRTEQVQRLTKCYCSKWWLYITSVI